MSCCHLILKIIVFIKNAHSIQLKTRTNRTQCYHQLTQNISPSFSNIQTAQSRGKETKHTHPINRNGSELIRGQWRDFRNTPLTAFKRNEWRQGRSTLCAPGTRVEPPSGTLRARRAAAISGAWRWVSRPEIGAAFSRRDPVKNKTAAGWTTPLCHCADGRARRPPFRGSRRFPRDTLFFTFATCHDHMCSSL